MRTHCPYCTDKLVEVERRASRSGSFATVKLRCTNPRCVFVMADYDFNPPARPAGTPALAGASAARWKAAHPEKQQAYTRRSRERKQARRSINQSNTQTTFHEVAMSPNDCAPRQDKDSQEVQVLP